MVQGTVGKKSIWGEIEGKNMIVDVKINVKFGIYQEIEQVVLFTEEFFRIKLFQQKYMFEKISEQLLKEMIKDLESYLKKICIWFSENNLFVKEINFKNLSNPIIILEKL